MVCKIDPSAQYTASGRPSQLVMTFPYSILARHVESTFSYKLVYIVLFSIKRIVTMILKQRIQNKSTKFEIFGLYNKLIERN